MKTIRKEFQKIIITVQDVLSLLGILFFAVYLLILESYGIGVSWLNYSLLMVTLLFSAFFFLKIILFNRRIESPNTSRKLKLAYRIAKYCLKLLLLIIIVVGLVSVISSGQGGFAIIITTIFSNLFFFIFLARDTLWFIRVHKKGKSKDKEDVKFKAKN